MKNDFDNIINFIANYNGKYFYEQSFMNYYFNKKGNINYEVINSNNYKMFPDLSVKYIEKIIHFCGSGDGNKLEKMNNYILTHLQ